MSAYGMNYLFGANVKACKHCGDLKSLDAFPKVPKARDGRGGRCYACANVVRRATGTDEKRAKTAARQREWKRLNQDKVRERRRIDDKRIFLGEKLRRIYNKAIRKALVSDRYSTVVEAPLAYSANDIRLSFERMFTDGMSWGAFERGGIVVDHIIPLNMFDLTTHDGVSKAWTLSNLQPMWLADHTVKSARENMDLAARRRAEQ
jgi:hypothetical protein